MVCMALGGLHLPSAHAVTLCLCLILSLALLFIYLMACLSSLPCTCMVPHSPVKVNWRQGGLARLVKGIAGGVYGTAW